MKIILFALIAFPCFAIAAPTKPNVILIYTDDHGWPDIGTAGIYDDLKTPHIDALAASGVRATSGYSSAPQCVPSRAGLLVGKSQNRFGVESNGESLEGFDAELTIADRLKAAGYATGQIGKWHLGQNPNITDHGFDDVYSKNANRPCHANYTLEGKTIQMQQVDDGLYHLDACSKAATTFIQRHEDEPFFLYLAYRAPHVPLDAPKKYLDRFPGKMPERRRQALAMISAMDDGVGEIVASLKQRGLLEKTLIFYIGDNGAPLKIHKTDAPGGGPGWDGSLNEPMNGEKGMLAEGGIRVPFLVSWPGSIPAGQVYDHPLSTLDVAATAVELAGLPEDDSLDGVNLFPYLSGKNQSAPDRALKWRWIAQAAIREGKWKLLKGGERSYLFDLESDPGEKTNLLGKHQNIAEQLGQKLQSWSDELKPPGLSSGSMSPTWEAYFDYYLDGKPAPAPGKSVSKSNGNQGWVSRNCSADTEEGALRIQPNKNKKQSPFIVNSGFKFPSPLTVKVKLKAASGKASIAWRCEDQKDFLPNQKMVLEPEVSPDWQDCEAVIVAKSPVIHLRLFLPHGGAEIQRIQFEDAKGELVKSWDFSKQK